MYRFILLLNMHISAIHNIGLNVNIICHGCNINSLLLRFQKDKWASKNLNGIVLQHPSQKYEYSLCLME